LNFCVPKDQPPEIAMRGRRGRLLLLHRASYWRSQPRSDVLTDREQDLQGRVGFFEVYHPLVQTDLAVLCLVIGLEASQFVLLQPSEGEDDVGAEVGLNVLRQELADLRAILRPVCVVAHQLHRRETEERTRG